MKKVAVTVTGRQRGEDGSETTVETRAPGACYERNGSLFLLYEEAGESGASPCRTRLKLTGSTLELTRQGDCSSCMVLEPGRTMPVDYDTPFGRLDMDVSAKKVEVTLRKDILEIRAEYALSSQGRLINHCLLLIRALDCGT